MLRMEIGHSRIRCRLKGAATRFLLLVGLLLPLGSHGPAPAPVLRVQPALLTLAAAHPVQPVQVIVQKAGAGGAPEQQTRALGGRVTQDLHLIHAFAAELPASAVPALAAAPGIRWISLDAPVTESASTATVDAAALVSAYPQAVHASDLWNAAPALQGQGIGVAVVDSGINRGHPDLSGSRVVAQAKFNSETSSMADQNGHGTHIAGIIAGNGTASQGAYVGVAPQANLINVKVSDDQGAASASDLVAGLQWINDNKARYNIRVVNISLNSSVVQSYHVDPIDAAVEILWFNGIVVVASAGNNSTAKLSAPANDPFVITVGATDDNGTAGIGDDTVAPFSGYGTTLDGFAKPDLVAPGTNIISLLASHGDTLVKQHRDHLVSGFPDARQYFRMSGTSMAAPVVAGAVALLLQANPRLNPDQVKGVLKATAVHDAQAWPGYTSEHAGAGYLDIAAAVQAQTIPVANTGQAASALLWTGSDPITWGSVSWNSVSWNSVSWNSVSWNSVSWNSVSWNSDYWGP
jgi:serine protease AprX